MQGDIVVPYAFDDSLGEVIAWLGAHPDELATLHLWDCTGDGCDAALAAALTARNLSVLDNCSQLTGLTYGDAKARGALPGGGALLALTVEGGCAVSNYDASINCAGYESGAEAAQATTTGALELGGTADAGRAEAALPHQYGCWTTDDTSWRW